MQKRKPSKLVASSTKFIKGYIQKESWGNPYFHILKKIRSIENWFKYNFSMETAISEIISANTSNILVHSVIKSWKSYDLSKYVNCQGLNSLVKSVIGNHESFKSQSLQIKVHFRLDFKIIHSMQNVSWHWIKTTNTKKIQKCLSH